MGKVHGYIAVDQQGKPILGPYGHVLLFKEPAIAMTADKAVDTKAVITAKVPRKKVSYKGQDD